MDDIKDLLKAVEDGTYEAEDLEEAEKVFQRKIELNTPDKIKEWARKAAEKFGDDSE